MTNDKIPTEYLLSIAIPTYKRPRYLSQAIRSAVNQKNHNLSYEIIVVNNDPETDMQAISAEFTDCGVPVTFFTNEKNIGMLGNVNRCVSHAKGKYIAFVHDDDLLLPNYLSEISDLLTSDKAGCIIPERFMLFEGDSASGRNMLEQKRKKKDLISSLFLSRYFKRHRLTCVKPEDSVFSWQNFYCAPSCGVVFRKEKLAEHGLFFPEGTYSWDFISFLEFNRNEPVYIYHKPLSVYRMSTGLSLRTDVQYDFFLSYEKLIKDFENNPKCGKFISEYINEIHNINYSVLDDEGKKRAQTEFPDIAFDLCDKHRKFMIRRIAYFAHHNLDVEKVLTHGGEKVLREMKIIGQNGEENE